MSVSPASLPDPPIDALDAAASRDEIARIVLDYAVHFAPRVALLLVRGGALVALDGRGIEASFNGQLALPLAPPSTLAEAVDSGKPFRGPMGSSPVERGWADRLGGVSGEVLLVPILVRDKSIALLYADGWSGLLVDAPIYAAAGAAGRAYERLILQRKKRGARPEKSKAPKAAPANGQAAAPAEVVDSAPQVSRGDPRYAIALDCLVRHDGTTLEGESRDLSRGGLCVRLSRALPLRASVELQLSLVLGENTFSEPIALGATVVWCTRLGGSHQVGTKFGEMDPETRENVDLFLRFLDAAPNDDDEIEEDPWA